MKKIAAVILSAVLLCTGLSVGVCAQGFTFREVAREQSGSSVWVTWNSSEATDDTAIEDVIIGEKSCSFTLGADNRLCVDISAVPAGVHTVKYEYVAGTRQETTVSSQPLTVEGVVAVQLSAVINADGTVTVTATGNGAPVAGYSLLMTIGNMAGITGSTDAKGVYTSYITVDNGQSLWYEGKSTTVGAVTYAAVARQTLKRVEATAATTVTTATATTTETVAETTAESEATTTATETETTVTEASTTVPSSVGTVGTTTAATVKTVLGSGTTAVKDGRVVLNASTDSGILSLFDCTANSFADRARLSLSADDYTSLVGRNTGNRLMLNVLTGTTPASEALVSEALAGASEFSDYIESDYSFLSFDLSFLVLDKSGKAVPVSAMPLGSTYVVELPIPASMKHCDVLAVTMMDGTSLMTPIKVKTNGGAFKLEINSLETYTLIGLVSADGLKSGGMSLWVVLLLVFGVLLLAGAGALLYFFFFRKSAAAQEKAEEKETAPVIAVEPENDNDIFSGRTDMPSSDE